MMMPDIEILVELKNFLFPVGAAAAEPFHVRHMRFKETNSSLWPCLAIERLRVLTENNIQAGSEGEYSEAEEIYLLETRFHFDTALPTDDSEDDPTGFGVASRMFRTCLESLFPESPAAGTIETLGGRIIDIRYDGTDETPDYENVSTSDYVRLVETMVFVYRVRSDRPHILLKG